MNTVWLRNTVRQTFFGKSAACGRWLASGRLPDRIAWPHIIPIVSHIAISVIGITDPISILDVTGGTIRCKYPWSPALALVPEWAWILPEFLCLPHVVQLCYPGLAHAHTLSGHWPSCHVCSRRSDNTLYLGCGRVWISHAAHTDWKADNCWVTDLCWLGTSWTVIHRTHGSHVRDGQQPSWVTGTVSPTLGWGRVVLSTAIQLDDELEPTGLSIVAWSPERESPAGYWCWPTLAAVRPVGGPAGFWPWSAVDQFHDETAPAGLLSVAIPSHRGQGPAEPSCSSAVPLPLAIQFSA